MSGSRSPSGEIADLLAIMAALRTPGTGCPWDLEQSFETIAPYTIEEAYEVADAVGRGDLEDLRDELGDLLLQVVFHSRLAEEHGAFDFTGVVQAISAKLIRRHPHVFGDARQLSPADVKSVWEAVKRAEKAERAGRRAVEGADPERASVLDGVPAGMPALTRAQKLSEKAAATGFEWPDVASVLAKIDEELGELREAVQSGGVAEMEDELGDLLFSVVNLARHLEVNPEWALAGANRKFERRFRAVERRLAEQGRSPTQSTLDEMDRLWDEAKAEERK
jgi:ATP diphosphatase